VRPISDDDDDDDDEDDDDAAMIVMVVVVILSDIGLVGEPTRRSSSSSGRGESACVSGRGLALS
jgi:hypothetical protein